MIMASLAVGVEDISNWTGVYLSQVPGGGFFPLSFTTLHHISLPILQSRGSIETTEGNNENGILRIKKKAKRTQADRATS